MHSLRWRVTLTHLGITFLANVVLCACLVYAVERSYVSERRQVLAKHASLVREEVLSALKAAPEGESLRRLCEQLSTDLSARIVLASRGGAPLVDTATPDQGSNGAMASGNRGRFGCHFCHSETSGARQLQVRVSLPPESGADTLTLMAPTAALEGTVRRIRFVMVGALLATLLVVGVIGTRLAAGIVSPILAMNQMVRRMAEGDLEQRLETHGSTEVGELAAGLNEMADRVRRAINALAEEKSKLETVVAQMADGIIVTDAGGNITLLNPAAERVFGVWASAVLGRQVYGATFSPDLQRAIARALAGEATVEEMRIRYPTPMVLGVFVSPFTDAEGRTQGAIVVLQDRTELRRLAEMQRDFIANATHELRTPVASIQATAETLLEGAKDDPAVRDRFVETLVRQSARLSSLLKDLLDLSRLDAGSGEITKVPVLAREVVQDVVALMQPALDGRDLRFLTSVPAGIHVSADRRLLTQALANLVDNAIKYTPDGGEVSVVARAGDGQVVFTVADTGIGISKADQERVFERFYRVDKARSRELGGTGLGLSITRDVVEAHGGTITLESQPGRGTTFTITLPQE